MKEKTIKILNNLYSKSRCPRKHVTFYDAIQSKNSIRFTFSFLNSVKMKELNQAYLHCFPGKNNYLTNLL